MFDKFAGGSPRALRPSIQQHVHECRLAVKVTLRRLELRDVTHVVFLPLFRPFERFWDRPLCRKKMYLLAIVYPPSLRKTWDWFCLVRATCLWEVNTKGIHIEPVEETSKALAEASQALVHELEVHQVRLQVGHGVGELAELGLEGVEREGRIATLAG